MARRAGRCRSGGDEVRHFCRLQRQALLAESRTLQTLRRERDSDPGAAFTIEVAILRTNAELECVEAAEARADQRLIDLPGPAEPAAEHAADPRAARTPVRRPSAASPGSAGLDRRRA